MEKLKTALVIISMATCCMFDSHAEISWLEERESTTTTFHVYLQQLHSGPNQSAFPVAAASITANSPTKFGQVFVVDAKLTAAPELDSDEVGRVQALSASAGMQTAAYSENLNFFFTSGKYSGCTVTVVGRNEVGEPEREMPVVGGTGGLRFARGYAVTTTYPNEDAAERTVREYRIYVTSSGE